MECPFHPGAEQRVAGTSEVLGIPINHKICGICGLGFADITADLAGKLEAYYKEEFWDSHQGRKLSGGIKQRIRSWLSEALNLRFDYASSYWRFFADYLDENAEIIEIGSGAGNTLVFLERKGYRVLGIEPDRDFVELTESRLKRGKVIRGFAHQLPELRVDAIVATHVLEHLPDPAGFLREAKKRLKPGGVIFLEVPNCDNPEILRDSVTNQPHLWHFTALSMKELLTREGYGILREIKLSPRYDPSQKGKSPLLFFTKRFSYQIRWIVWGTDLFREDAEGAVYRIVTTPA